MQWLGVLIFGLVLVFFGFQIVGMIKDIKAKKAKKKRSESGEVPPEEDKTKKED